MAKIMEDDPDFQDQVKELEKLDMLMAIGENYLESSLQSVYICQIDKAIDTQNALTTELHLAPQKEFEIQDTCIWQRSQRS